jgi:NADP-dependent 3-hydroxy acid dehydrogenase YdfG
MLIRLVSELPVENWEHMITLNQLGLPYMTHAALPYLIKSKGHIVNTSSVTGRTTNQGSVAYSMTKWGVNAFTDALRKELVDGKTKACTTLIESGEVAAELRSHNKPAIQKKLKERFGDIKILPAASYMLCHGHYILTNLLIRRTEQPLQG